YINIPAIYTLFFLMTPRPPRSTLFPYTTLFRSHTRFNNSLHSEGYIEYSHSGVLCRRYDQEIVVASQVDIFHRNYGDWDHESSCFAENMETRGDSFHFLWNKCRLTACVFIFIQKHGDLRHECQLFLETRKARGKSLHVFLKTRRIAPRAVVFSENNEDLRDESSCFFENMTTRARSLHIFRKT